MEIDSGIKYDKEDEVVNVCQAIQEMRKESERDGELKKAREAARNFYHLGVDVEKIAQGVGSPDRGWHTGNCGIYQSGRCQAGGICRFRS